MRTLGMAYKPSYLTCAITLSLSTRARNCQHTNAYVLQRYLIGESSLRIRHLSPRILSIDALSLACSQSMKQCVTCQKFLLKNFCERLKFAKLKTHKNFLPAQFIVHKYSYYYCGLLWNLCTCSALNNIELHLMHYII